MPFIAVYDADVLYPNTLRDLVYVNVPPGADPEAVMHRVRGLG
jgi:hypothetical protein